MEVSDPATIYCDNLSSIQLAKNPVFHARTKHIEVHYHFVRERVLSGEVELTYVPTDRQFSGALGLRNLDVPNLRGEKSSKTTEGSRKGVEVTVTSNRMTDSISGR